MKAIKRITLGATFALAIILGVQMFVSSTDMNLTNSLSSRPRTTAVTTWTEQSFNESFWGDGWRQLRRRFVARGLPASTIIVHENTRLAGSWINGTSVYQTGHYTQTVRRGHQISATAQARSHWLQFTVGYTFIHETTTSFGATANIPPNRRIEVWQSDVRVRHQFVLVDVFRQRWSGGFLGIGGSWQDTGERWFEDEIIREFGGNNITFLEFFA